MSKQNPKQRPVDLTLMLRVGKYGSGTYLRIPSDIAKALMLTPGDRLQVHVESILSREEKQQEKELSET